jgi:plastocyanin
MTRLYAALALLGALVLSMVACQGEEEGTPTPAARTTPATGATPTPPAAGAATPTAPAGAVTVRAVDFAFNPARLTAQPNQPLTVTVRNEGQAPHTFTIQELNVDVTLQPGQSMTVTFTPRAASHTFVCRFHAGAGMTGTLTTGGGAGGGATTPTAGGASGYGY